MNQLLRFNEEIKRQMDVKFQEMQSAIADLAEDIASKFMEEDQENVYSDVLHEAEDVFLRCFNRHNTLIEILKDLKNQDGRL